jgi:hypothetical protein
VLFAVCYFILRLILRIAPGDDMKEREAEILSFAINSPS